MLARSLTPENILIDDDGYLSLNLLSFAPSSGLITAPELASGGKYSEATDWFSLGCLMYYMAYGCLPFEYKED